MHEPLTRVVLVGFMGAGKSSVGRALAERLGWRFVDTDELVQALSGRTIPELFADGEPFFRQWEAQAIATLFAEEHLVIAAGGGALTHPESRRMLQALGPTVWLDAPLDVLWARAGADPARPLSLDPADFNARHAARLPLYRQSPLRLDTENLSPAEAADWLHRQLTEEASTVEVALGDRAYPITIQPGALPALPRLLEGTPGRCLVVTDTHVRDLYAEPLIAALELSGWHPALAVVPAGEPSKCLEQASALYDQCVRLGLKRHHPVIALGGGVVGDLAGFIAATYQRGVPFVQVPTTLLAQIDSSVGGKVGINHPGGKNLIGAFYQPRLVLADTSTLLTLSDREYLAGLAELVKYGVIMDAALFALIEAERERLLARDLPLLNRVVRRACELKAEVVRQDEREGGLRAILNFGHTVGHAIEAIAGYGEFLHGEAVAIGMVAESRLAGRRGLLDPATIARIETLIATLGLPTAMPPLDPDDFLAAMGRDKKNLDTGVTFILPTGIGEVRIASLPANELDALLPQ